MSERDPREEKDILITEGEQTFIRDGSKGNVRTYVGPMQATPSGNDKTVAYNAERRRFEIVPQHQAVVAWPAAEQGQYVMLTAPAANGKQPQEAGVSALTELSYGKRQNIPGPWTQPLWPGQTAQIIDGHTLKSNQYLLVRVYDEEEARQNWGQEGVIKKTSGEEAENNETSKEENVTTAERKDLTVGKQLIVKGNSVAFFIPPTGIEVLKDEDGDYVRNAVTLEKLEYCVLLGEDGTKEYRRGPDVVFPSPTQVFKKDSEGNRKFKARELNPHWGIHIKVIESYTENGKEYKEGDELFITGKDTKIYYPRQEHSIITYGDGTEIHYAIAIPKGEARYVMNRSTGDIRTEKGPAMFLPNPIEEVIVRRVMDPTVIRLLYPDNEEALNHNVNLAKAQKMALKSRMRGGGRREKFSHSLAADDGLRCMSIASAAMEMDEVSDELMSDEFKRKTEYTPPRTIELKTKYEGAVMIGVWTGYAVKIVSKTGEQRVIVGPKTALLEYDETVEPFSLSAGKPKGTKPAVRDVYLRVKANKVSDIIEEAETKDFVRVRIPISYRVNFEGDEKKWFDVEDYVKFLCDHLRSLITNTVKKYGIEEFNLNYIDILRDAILGTTGGESKERTGRSFEENGMRIYDVELGRLEIGNDGIAKLLQDSQHESVRHALEINARRKDLEVTTEKERIAQQISKARAETTAMDIEINKETTKIRHGYDLEKANNEVELETKRLEAQVANQQQEDEIAKAELQRQKNRDDQKLSVIKEETDIKTGAKERELKAITPGLIEAMMTQGEMGLAQALAKNLPQSIHHADGISAVLDTVKDTPIGRGLEQLLRKREKVKTRD